MFLTFTRVYVHSGAPAARRAAKRSPITIATWSHACIEIETHAALLKMASGMDHGRVDDDVAQHGGHPANTKSCSLGLQHISLILHFDMMFNLQLSYQEIRWPVSRDHIVGSGLELIKVACFLSWPLTKCWFSIGSRAHARWTCWKQGRIVRKPVNTRPRFNVPGLMFSSIQVFFAALFCLYV